MGPKALSKHVPPSSPGPKPEAPISKEDLKSGTLRHAQLTNRPCPAHCACERAVVLKTHIGQMPTPHHGTCLHRATSITISMQASGPQPPPAHNVTTVLCREVSCHVPAHGSHANTPSHFGLPLEGTRQQPASLVAARCETRLDGGAIAAPGSCACELQGTHTHKLAWLLGLLLTARFQHMRACSQVRA
jgi:hypothetical protein